MNKFIWILIGVSLVVIGALLIYPSQVYIKMRSSKTKIRNILKQIEGQVSIKHSLLKEYLEINKDSMTEEKYNEIYLKLKEYGCDKNIEILKDFNQTYSEYMYSFDDNLLNNQCKNSEEKIGYIKEYYNELVSSYNNYKANKINNFVAKIMSIKDEQLY